MFTSKNNKAIALLSLLLIAGLFTACSSSDSGINNGGGIDGTGYGITEPEGQFNLYITDGPIDEAENVVIAFDAIVITDTNDIEHKFSFDEALSIDVLVLQGWKTAFLLKDVSLPVGEYRAIRLHILAVDDGVQDSWVQLKDGTRRELILDAASKDGSSIDKDFVITEDKTSELIIDFDLRKSLIIDEKNAEALTQHPQLSIVENEHSGHITGTIKSHYVDKVCKDTPDKLGVVYLYPGKSAHKDKSFDATTFIASALVTKPEDQFLYQLGFIEASDFTLLYSCQDLASSPFDRNQKVKYKAKDTKVKKAETTETNF